MDTHKSWIKETFDRAADTYGTEGCTFFAHFGRTLVRTAKIWPGAEILDIATGTGAVLLPLAEAVGTEGHITGIDISEKMLEQAQHNVEALGHDNVTLHCMDAEQLAFPDCRFDYVTMGFCLPLLSNPERCVEEIFRVLKPGGKLVASVWDSDQDLPVWVAQEAHKLGATRQVAIADIENTAGFRSLLERAGFDALALSEETESFYWDGAEAWWDGLWTHGFRHIFEQLDAHSLADLKHRTMERCAHLPRIEERLTAIFGIGTKSAS